MVVVVRLWRPVCMAWIASATWTRVYCAAYTSSLLVGFSSSFLVFLAIFKSGTRGGRGGGLHHVWADGCFDPEIGFYCHGKLPILEYA